MQNMVRSLSKKGASASGARGTQMVNKVSSVPRRKDVTLSAQKGAQQLPINCRESIDRVNSTYTRYQYRYCIG
jgi:hypothetical protein